MADQDTPPGTDSLNFNFPTDKDSEGFNRYSLNLEPDKTPDKTKEWWKDEKIIGKGGEEPYLPTMKPWAQYDPEMQTKEYRLRRLPPIFR